MDSKFCFSCGKTESLCTILPDVYCCKDCALEILIEEFHRSLEEYQNEDEDERPK